MNQKPSVARTVHYVSAGSADGSYPSVCRAAIVTAVDEYQAYSDRFIGHVDLAVLNPEGMHFRKGVHQDEDEKRPQTWHWPERV